MKSLFLELELLSDVAIPASSATVGGSETLRHIPGACLLGAVASTCYAREASAGRAFDLFHAGKVRFGNALPLFADGSPAYPVPMSLHERKGAGEGPALVNLARGQRPQGQYTQVREGFVDDRLRRLHLSTTESMRTAIGDEGRAREGFLFSLEALAQGQRFHARVDADDDTLLDVVRSSLVGKTIRVGRSRSAELGQVKVVEVVDPHPVRVAGPAPSAKHEALVIIWALSDLCLRDPVTGQPTFTPRPDQLGLPANSTLDLVHSFLRTRRYSPFNGYRKKPDLERQVIEAGSVIAFRVEGDVGAVVTSARAHVARGIGEHRAEGLGQVAVEPQLLSVDGATWAEPGAKAVVAAAPLPGGPLGVWIGARIDEQRRVDGAYELAQGWLGDEAVKGSLGRVTRAQWGTLRWACRPFRLGDATRRENALVADIEKLVDAGGRGVRAQRWAGKAGQTLKELAQRGRSGHDDIVVASALELLAAHFERRNGGDR